MPKSAKERDRNGYVLIKGCPLSRAGIFQYSAGQIGLSGDKNRIVNVFRPEEAINDPEAIESFKNLPLIDDHTYLSGKYGDANDQAPEDKGVDGVLTGNVYFDSPWMRGDLKVFSRRMEAQMEAGKTDLSLGFDCTFTEQPGVWQGEPYEVIQTNLRGNHLALVQTGRVPGARVLDGLCFDHLDFSIIPSKEESKMDPKENDDKAMDDGSPVSELRAMLPQFAEALKKFLGEEAKEPEHQEGLKEEADLHSAEAERDDAAAKVDAEAAEHERKELDSDPDLNTEVVKADVEVEGAGGEDELDALISQIEQVIAEIRQARGSAEDTDDTKAQDAIHGLQEKQEGAQMATDEAEKAKRAEDAALARFYADADAKGRVYDRLSKVVGSFDHRAMDSAGVIDYGIKKLGIKCGDSAEVKAAALTAFLDGADRNKAVAAQQVQARAQDAAESCDEINQYLNGGK